MSIEKTLGALESIDITTLSREELIKQCKRYKVLLWKLRKEEDGKQ